MGSYFEDKENMIPPDYEERPRKRSGSNGASEEDLSQEGGTGLQGHLTQMVLEAGSRQVKEALDSYGRIDLFRPYFDVEPRTVRNRLLQSLVPKKPSAIRPATDLYGPLMLIFTLVALLLFSMKSSGYTLQDGTLIGTALVTCFAYWCIASSGLYAMAYVFNTDVPMIQVFSMVGYALFGHCIVILLTTLFTPSHSHLFFYSLTGLLALPSAARLGIYLAYKTKERTHKLVLAGLVALVHLSFLLYLYFGFQVTLEEIEELMGDAGPLHNIPVDVAAAQAAAP